MEIRETNFIPVLLGSDINTYSMARAFHEAYKIRSVVLGKYPAGPSYHSRITEFSAIPDLEVEEVFLREMRKVSARYPNKKILLFGCGDNYLTLIAKNKEKLPSNFVTVYIPYEQMLTLIDKEQFYALANKVGIDCPKTYIHHKKTGSGFELPFGFPVILKPSDGVMYWNHPFSGQKKVFKLTTREELEATLSMIYMSGYDSSLVVQDFIPGDDTYMRVLTCYSDRNAKVKMMCLGHVILEEHTPKGLGNHAAIVTDYTAPLFAKIKEFLESIQYTGFSNFDIKYDERDGSYRVFEINVRQGRSNYYVTASGYNIAKAVVGDRIEGKDLVYTEVVNKVLWLVIPLRIVLNSVSGDLKKEIEKLVAEKKVINSLFYKGDLAPRRLLYLLRSYFSHFVKYKKYY